MGLSISGEREGPTDDQGGRAQFSVFPIKRGFDCSPQESRSEYFFFFGYFVMLFPLPPGGVAFPQAFKIPPRPPGISWLVNFFIQPKQKISPAFAGGWGTPLSPGPQAREPQVLRIASGVSPFQCTNSLSSYPSESALFPPLTKKTPPNNPHRPGGGGPEIIPPKQKGPFSIGGSKKKISFGGLGGRFSFSQARSQIGLLLVVL